MGIPHTIARLADAKVERRFATSARARHVEFSVDSGKILIADRKRVTIWNRRLGRAVTHRVEDGSVKYACFAPNGSEVVLTTSDQVEIRDASLKTVHRTIKVPGGGSSFVFARHTPDSNFSCSQRWRTWCRGADNCRSCESATTQILRARMLATRHAHCAARIWGRPPYPLATCLRCLAAPMCTWARPAGVQLRVGVAVRCCSAMRPDY